MRPPGGGASRAGIRVLYSEGCPGGEASAKVLRAALSETAPGTEVELVRMSSLALLELGAPGSPTILVNGRDLFPAEASSASDSCRLYATPEGPRSHPTTEMVLSSVAKLSDDELSPILGVGDPEEAAKILLGRGVSLVLVSMGREGAFYATSGFGGSLPQFEIDEVTDATGAGDAFLAATLTHLSESPRWLSDEAVVREAVRRGTAAGALACADYGAMRALPTREELERFMSVHS